MVKIKKILSPFERKLKTVGKTTFVALYADRYSSAKIGQILRSQTYSNKNKVNKPYTQNSIDRKTDAMGWFVSHGREKDALWNIMHSPRVPKAVRDQAAKYYRLP